MVREITELTGIRNRYLRMRVLHTKKENAIKEAERYIRDGFDAVICRSTNSYGKRGWRVYQKPSRQNLNKQKYTPIEYSSRKNYWKTRRIVW